MQKSISQIIKYDQDIIIYPGHGPKTTLKEEINNLISLLLREENRQINEKFRLAVLNIKFNLINVQKVRLIN